MNAVAAFVVPGFFFLVVPQGILSGTSSLSGAFWHRLGDLRDLDLVTSSGALDALVWEELAAAGLCTGLFPCKVGP